MKKIFSILIAIFTTFNIANAQTTLSAGDISFTGYISSGPSITQGNNSVTTETFSFVLLTNISNGTVLSFTDRGWSRTSATTGSFLSNIEGTVTWTCNGNINAGTEVKVVTTGIFDNVNALPVSSTGVFSINGTANGSVSGSGYFSLSTSGDQILIYQGSASNPSFITAIHMNVYSTGGGDLVTTTTTDWDGTFDNQNACGLPKGLTSGTTALWVGTQGDKTTEFDNANFNCSASGIDLSTLSGAKTALFDKTKWNKDNTSGGGFTLPTNCNYLVSPCSSPTLPTINASTTTNCGTVATTLSIASGSLNSATNWQWYTGSCGGTSAGSGTSITPSPSATTTYFVRSEGGCVTAGSCASVTITVNSVPSTPTITPTGPTTFCAGGSVFLLSSASSGNQWYVGGNPIGGATNQFYQTNASGTYTVVSTVNGCSSAASLGTTVTVNPNPSTPTIPPGSATTFCQGGSVFLSSNVANGNQWYVGGNPLGGATNQTYTATTSGTYTVVVTSNGCNSASSLGTVVTVNIPTTSDTTAAVCNKFTWHDSTYIISTDAVWHTTNAGGCDSTRTLHLTILSVTSTTSKTDATCNGTNTGSITVTPTYGVSPFSYRIGTVAAYGASNTFNNLRAGSYRVSILDANGCAGITSQVIITQPIAVTGTAVATNSTCYGLSDGSITVTPTTGIGPHTYRLDNVGTFTSSNVFNNVKAGAYRVFIQDVNGCVGSILVNVTQPTKVSGTSTKTDETCPNAKNGSITVTGSGGTSPYTYRFGSTGSFALTKTFSNLKAGNYRVFVNDANGCSGFSILTTVGQTSGSCLSTRAILPEINPSYSNLKVTLTPNPSSSKFGIQVNSTRKESVQIRVIDYNGRTVHTIKGISEKLYYFGEQWAPGLYMIEIRQGDEVKTMKAVKN